MNFIDRVIAAVSPEKAVKRAAARASLSIINSGYGNYGASSSRTSLRGWNWFGGSAEEDIHENLDTLRQRSRDLYSGVPMATAALKTMRTNVVGQGLKLKSQVDFRYLGMDEKTARETEAILEREVSLFADSENCDAERLDNFYELQQVAFLNWLMSGDVLALMPLKKRVGAPYELTIQLIEADRISTPDNKTFDPLMKNGVERDESGEVVAYWISDNHPLAADSVRQPNEWHRVRAFGEKTGRRNVLFIMNRERIGQYRGVPFVAPVVEALKQLGRYTDAELMAAVISGMFTVFIEKDGVSEEEPPVGELDDDYAPDDRTAAGAIRLGNGSIVDLQDGEKAHDVNPGRPNANFDGFVKAISAQIGAALEMPHEVLLKEFTASYSASKGALEEAWEVIKMRRSWFVNDFCQPVYEVWLAEAVARGRIKAPGFFDDPLIRAAWCSARWDGPALTQLDPKKEAESNAMLVQHGWKTNEQITREYYGENWEDNMSALAVENELIKNIIPAQTNNIADDDEEGDEENADEE